MDKKEKEALVAKYGKDKLRILEIPVDEKQTEMIEATAVVPSRTVLGQYMKWTDSNPKKAQEILLRGCLLSHKEQIEADDFMFNTTVALLADLIPIGQGNIKKFF
ncbi:MAG: hypothetical protein PSN34_06290 [Urechidicola sp.]|nr:hypothetical protein [Urechidicola sp.]